MKLLFQSLSASALLLLAVNAHALSDETTAGVPAAPKISPTKPGFHVVVNGGMTYGGDTIATAIYSNGDTATIKGGALMQFGIGGLYQFENRPLALMLSANYHFDSVSGSNGSLSFSRFPIEVLAYYTGKERFRFGGGMRFINSPEYSGLTQNATFENTTGVVAEIGYQVAPQGWLNFRFVSEKYQLKTLTSSGITYSGAGTAPYSGSHLGINFTYEFQ
ncbi:MAG: hypothetical protein PHQ60_08305 [Sideroxydans sp.]|nr:hypothetical protein [Sideroxydans sp.]